MNSKFFCTLLAALMVVAMIASPLGMVAAQAEEIDPFVPSVIPGTLEAVGTSFQVLDSQYLNVGLTSSEPISVIISSVPSVVEVRLEAAEGALSTQLTLTGLVPLTTYHQYTDDLENHIIFTADEMGAYSWSQDLVDPHLIFFQTQPSTKILSDTSTGGHCTQIGSWNAATKTCTLTVDLAETIQINSNGITLDGAGHQLTGVPNLGEGVLVPGTSKAATTGVTIKNLVISGFRDGVALVNAQGCTVINNTIQNVNRYGINIWPTLKNFNGNNQVLENRIESTNTGIYLKSATGNKIRGNLVDGLGATSSTGIDIDGSSNIVTGNRVVNAEKGIQNMSGNSFQRNTVDANYSVDGGMGAFYNNNLAAYQFPFFQAKRTQTLSTSLPFAGNYWAGFDAADEGCPDVNNDRLCDASYSLLNKNLELAGTDEMPWKQPDGWLHATITAPVNPLPIESVVTASAAFSDVDVNATHTATWEWGDGTSSIATVSEAGGSGTISVPTHIYAQTGVYQLTLTIKDAPYLSTVKTYFEYVVIYDPSEGFVSGGGWIDSPAGAYVADPTLTGHASFGFTSKYAKGKTVPEGETKFEFHTDVIRFVSTSYEWLVIGNATQAMYKGVGTLNGLPGYSFILTAIDGATTLTPDQFRIRIWYTVEGDNAGLVYDNKIGSAPNDYVGTAIGDGNIMINTTCKTNK